MTSTKPAAQSSQVIRGASWLYTLRWLDRLLGLASLTLLARTLSEGDFGLVMIAASYVAIVEGLSQFDVNRALIQSAQTDRALLDSGWTLSLARGVATATILAVAAWMQPDATMSHLILVLAAAPILDGLTNPKFSLFERNLDFSKAALIGLLAKLISVAATIAVLIIWKTYWAVVVGILVNSSMTLLLSYLAAPFGPKLSLRRARQILSFSGWMSLANMLSTLSMSTDRLIVGHFVGVADAGRYTMTQRVGSLPTAELMSPLQRVLFPSFRKLAATGDRLRHAVLETVNVMGTLSLSASVGFALVAHNFVPLVLGRKWSSIVPLMVILVPYLGLRATLAMAQPCAMALGRTRLLFQASLIYAVIHLPIFIGATWKFGLRGAIVAIVIAGIAYIALNAWLLYATVRLSPASLAKQLLRPLIAAGAMTVSVPAVGRWLVDYGWPSPTWRHLAAEVAVGSATFIGVLALLWLLAGRPAGIEARLLALVRNLGNRSSSEDL